MSKAIKGLQNFPTFRRKVLARLRQGAHEYGDKSFSWDHLSLLDEIKQELLDVCGWSYILYERLSRIETHMSRSLFPEEGEESDAEGSD